MAWRQILLCMECGEEVVTNESGDMPPGPCLPFREGQVEAGCAITIARIWEPEIDPRAQGLFGSGQQAQVGPVPLFGRRHEADEGG